MEAESGLNLRCETDSDIVMAVCGGLAMEYAVEDNKNYKWVKKQRETTKNQ